MKTFKNFIVEAKKCPKGQYYCFTDKKCKKIPTGYRVGFGGRLAPDNRSDSDDDNKNGNGKNGNGNGSNGNGSNGGGNGGNGGGNGGGGGE
jgi:hypothetical protein